MVKRGYKQTEIGIIPEDWSLSFLEKHMKIETGSRNTQHRNENGKYPFFVRSQHVERIDTYHYDCEAVLTAGDGVGTGKVFHYVNQKFDAHQRVYVMYQFQDIEAKYFFYYFKENFFNEVSKYTAKSSVDSVRRDMIAKMIIPLPPLPEQEAIAKALSDVDGLITLLEKLIEKKKAVKQGAMQQLLTGKKRLPGFSGSWVEITLGEIAEIKDGTHQTPSYVSYGIPFYSVENVSNNNFSLTKYISAEEHRQLTASYKIERGDILMTRIGSIGDCKYIDWDVDASFYVSLAVLKCCEAVDARFIAFYTSTESFKKETQLNSLQQAIPKKINLGQIAVIKLFIPNDKAEQTAIANILSDMNTEIEALQKKLTKARLIKQGMMQELPTGRIRLVDADGKAQPQAEPVTVAQKK